MCTTFSHNFKNIIQEGQNHSCDTIALKRRIICDSEATRFKRRQNNAKNDNVVLYKVQMYNVY